VIDILYGISLFICTTKTEVDSHAKRLLTAQLIAVACFILFPLTFSFDRPAIDGFFGILFTTLASFDHPFNQAPSLHIVLLVILWFVFIKHLPRYLLWAFHVFSRPINTILSMCLQVLC
jgi:membrane-associated phospholipid phosphatase